MKPLAGRRVLVTRAAEQAEELVSLIEGLGGVAVRCPTLTFAAAGPTEALDEAIRGLGRYDWLVVTSANGARFLARRAEQLGAALALPAGPRVAAVGRATAAALAEIGLATDFVPAGGTGVELARGLEPVEGLRVLLARGDLADPAPVRVLTERGARVDEVVTYRTLATSPPPEALEELRRGVDVVTFTSPSTVEGLARSGSRWRDPLAGAMVACIGPTTAEAARQAGLAVHVEAAERTMASLVEAVVRGLASEAPRGAPEEER